MNVDGLSSLQCNTMHKDEPPDPLRSVSAADDEEPSLTPADLPFDVTIKFSAGMGLSDKQEKQFIDTLKELKLIDTDSGAAPSSAISKAILPVPKNASSSQQPNGLILGYA